MFDWYSGNNIDSIYKHKGSLVKEGNNSIPTLGYGFVSNEGNHSQNMVLTGDNFDFNSMNIIEPQKGFNYIVPNCEVDITYYYTYKTENGTKNNLGTQIIARYTIKNGVATNLRFNPNLLDKIITKRDTIPPKNNITTPQNNTTYTSSPTLNYNIAEENFKEAWYTIDNTEKKTIGQNGVVNLNLDKGDHTLIIGSKDYFNLTSTDTIRFTIKPTSTYDATNNKANIYPNPTTGPIAIVYPEGKNAVIQFYNMNGKTLEKIVDIDKDGRTDTEITHPAGTYIYRIEIGKESYTGKITKQ